MLTTLGYAAGASLPLLLGALVGIRWRPPHSLVATALAFAAGALLAAAAFELFEPAYAEGGALRVGVAFAAGAVVFVAADYVMDRKIAGSPTGWALLAAVTLDGIPENTALGVSLTTEGSIALLVAVFASNFPEALAGSISMQDQGHSKKSIVTLWVGATVLLGASVFLGRFAFSGASDATLAYPLAFAAGAVITSVIDTLAPEAFGKGGPLIALASAAGFGTGFALSL